MKTYFKKQLAKCFALAFPAITFLSLTARAGGESYEIYLNSKLICKQVNGKFLCGEKGLQLSKSNINDNLVITYNHCGRSGTGRTVIVKDEHDRKLKEWKFDDNATITIPVKEILNLQKGSNGGLKLYYFSEQYLPKGRMLTSVNIKEKDVAQYNLKQHWFAAATLLFICARLA